MHSPRSRHCTDFSMPSMNAVAPDSGGHTTLRHLSIFWHTVWGTPWSLASLHLPPAQITVWWSAPRSVSYPCAHVTTLIAPGSSPLLPPWTVPWFTVAGYSGHGSPAGAAFSRTA